MIADPGAFAAVQGSIVAGYCFEFDYLADGAQASKRRRVIPYALIHGPITYLIGQMPGGNLSPVPYRLDRMREVRASNLASCPPEDWDLDAWMGLSFGVWREDDHNIVLRVLPGAADRARAWRFHPAQTMTDEGDQLLVRFRAGGLREVMRERVLLVLGSI